jgi:SAM-dependent methyltransferase
MTATTDRADALAERLLDATLGALELYSIFLGAELGLYRTPEAHGPATPDELAARAGIAPRYAVEWLEQQAVADLLEALPGAERRYALGPDHPRVLAHPDDPGQVAPFAQMVAGIGGGRAFRHGQGHINRPAVTHELASDWLPAMPDVLARLESAQHARIADVGCGQGFSTLALASAFLDAHVDDIDADAASIADARARAADAGADGRVRFIHADASELAGPYELITMFEALHDMTDPVAALRAARAALAPGGTVLVVDEKVADTFTAPGDPIERMMYGWSVTHCLPSQLAEQHSAALGTVRRARTLHQLAAAAGYARVDVLPIDDEFFRLYRLDV